MPFPQKPKGSIEQESPEQLRMRGEQHQENIRTVILVGFTLLTKTIISKANLFPNVNFPFFLILEILTHYGIWNKCFLYAIFLFSYGKRAIEGGEVEVIQNFCQTFPDCKFFCISEPNQMIYCALMHCASFRHFIIVLQNRTKYIIALPVILWL